MNIEIAKKEFMHREVCSMCFLASFGMALRIPFYKKEADRELIKEYLREELWKLITNYYSRKVEDKEHVEVIVDIKNKVNNKFSEQLSGDGMTFGRAQKLVNLYLKYMWVCGYIKEPPHCPVDSNIIKELGKESNEIKKIKSWIKMSQQDYEKIKKAIKERVKREQSIAEWELITFNDRPEWRLKT